MMTDYSNPRQAYLYEKIRNLEQNVSRLSDHSEEVEREELLVALEELHVAEEELRQQNIALYATQKQMLREHRKYVTLFELSPVGHVLTTPSGEIREANKALINLLQFSGDFLSHKPLQEFVADSTQLSTFLASLQTTLVVEREICFQPRIGDPIVTSVTMTPIVGENGEIQHLLWVIYDLRDQKRVAQVEIERQMTAQKMQAQLDAEKTVSSLKTQIMMIINHGFRTPLSIIQAASSNLDAYLERMTNKKRLEKFHTIYEQIRRLADMLDEIGIVVEGVSRISELNCRPLDIHSYCEDLIREIRGSYGQFHNINFVKCDQVDEVLVDPYLLGLILRNLLNNAILYSTVRSEIRLILSRSDSDLIFEVVDQGIGIPSWDQALIFKAIHRGSNVTNRPGLGLGLTIAKECADLHGGTLAFISEVNVGTTFTLRLPVFSTPL